MSNEPKVGDRFEAGSAWMTVLAVAGDRVVLKIGKFDSLGEAADDEGLPFVKPLAWVKEKMDAAEILGS